MWKQWQTLFGGTKKSLQMENHCSHEIKRCLLLGRKVMTNLGSILGEGNGNPLQYSCLENPLDRGAWWSAVHKVTQSWTQLKRHSSSSRQHIKKQRHYFANKGMSSQGYGFSIGHIWMWELEYKESWAMEELMLLNCDVGEDSWESLGLQGDPTSWS